MIDVKFITSLGEKLEDGREKQLYLEEVEAAQVINLISQRFDKDHYHDFRGGFAIDYREKPWNSPGKKQSASYLYDDLNRTTQWLTALSDLVSQEEQRTSFSWLDNESTHLELNKRGKLVIEHESKSTKLRALKVDAKEFFTQMIKSSKKLNKFIGELSQRIEVKTAESPLNPISKRLLEVHGKLESLQLADKIKKLEQASRKL